jgi:hypothetical protein
VAVDGALAIRLCQQLGTVDDALVAEPFGIFLSFGHIIAVRQEDVKVSSASC